MSAFAELVGARVRRIDGPKPDLFALTLHHRDRRGALLLRTAPRAAWGWLEDRPRGMPASAFVQLLRKHVENGLVRAIEITEHGARIDVARGDTLSIVELETDPPNLALTIGDRRIALRPGVPRAHGHALARDFHELQAHGPRIVESELDARVSVLDRTIARRVRKLERRREAIEGDLDRRAEIDELRHRASLLLAHLATIARGTAQADVIDFATQRPTRIAIDPQKGPKGEAEALFRSARKLERAAQIAVQRREQTEAELAALRALRDRLRASPDEIDAIAKEAGRLGARPEGRSDRAPARLPYRRFRCAGDRIVLVGRSAADNDALLQMARPHDLWLHARGISGSHAIVPLEKNEACPSELLIDAAHLAAHFSAGRGEPTVEVQHAPRRYVRKARGAAPGAVTVTHEKVIALRFSPERIAKIVASEDHA